MKQTHLAGVLVVALMLGSAALGQEPDQQKYLLKEAAVGVGDVYVVAVRTSTEIQVRGVPEGSKEAVVDAPFVLTVQEKYTTNVLAVSGGNPVHFTRKYNISKVTNTKTPGADPTTTSLPRHGKTLTVRIKGKTVTLDSGKVKLPAAEIAALKKAVSPAAGMSPYPAHPVAPGEEWTLEGKELLKRSGGTVTRLQGKFEDIVDYEGRPCARISITMVTEAVQAGIPIVVTMTGEVKHALDIHRDLIVNLSGDVNVKNKVTQNGVTLEISAQGTSSMTQTEVWLKRKGKPVLKPKPAATTPTPMPEPQ